MFHQSLRALVGWCPSWAPKSCPAWGLRIAATSQDVPRGSDFSSRRSEPTRPPHARAPVPFSGCDSARPSQPWHPQGSPVLQTRQPWLQVSTFSLILDGTGMPGCPLYFLLSSLLGHRGATEVGVALPALYTFLVSSDGLPSSPPTATNSGAWGSRLLVPPTPSFFSSCWRMVEDGVLSS